MARSLTPETVWPPGAADQVMPLSDEIAPNVYQVPGGTERDQTELVSVPRCAPQSKRTKRVTLSLGKKLFPGN